MLQGIGFVLSTGIGWAELPTELGCGPGWTCWRRMHEWAETASWLQSTIAVNDQRDDTLRRLPARNVQRLPLPFEHSLKNVEH